MSLDIFTATKAPFYKRNKDYSLKVKSKVVTSNSQNTEEYEGKLGIYKATLLTNDKASLIVAEIIKFDKIISCFIDEVNINFLISVLTSLPAKNKTKVKLIFKCALAFDVVDKSTFLNFMVEGRHKQSIKLNFGKQEDKLPALFVESIKKVVDEESTIQNDQIDVYRRDYRLFSIICAGIKSLVTPMPQCVFLFEDYVSCIDYYGKHLNILNKVSARCVIKISVESLENIMIPSFKDREVLITVGRIIDFRRIDAFLRLSPKSRISSVDYANTDSQVIISFFKRLLSVLEGGNTSLLISSTALKNISSLQKLVQFTERFVVHHVGQYDFFRCI